MTEQEFLEFWLNYQWGEIVPVYHRLYYDNTGLPLFYSQENLPGKYIDITPEQFALQEMNVKVIDGKLVSQRITRISKLVPAASGTLCDATDVTVVRSNQPGQYWKKKLNVIKTN